MKTLMYPIAPDDDFPEMFCAIRQGSGEHWFYAPEGESASWILFRAETENAKLRELVSGLEYCVQGFVCVGCPLYDPSGNHRRCESLERELGIEVEQ